MIAYETGSIFDEEADAIVCPVNCVGMMGAGLAKQFKERYPQNFLAYKHACAKGEVVPGRIFIHKVSDIYPPYYIFNFPTKRNFEDESLIEDIDVGMEDLVRAVNLLELRSIAIPQIGAGLGKLDYWEEVWPIISKHVWTNPLMKKEFILLVDAAQSRAYHEKRMREAEEFWADKPIPKTPDPGH